MRRQRGSIEGEKCPTSFCLMRAVVSWLTLSFSSGFSAVWMLNFGAIEKNTPTDFVGLDETVSRRVSKTSSLQGKTVSSE